MFLQKLSTFVSSSRISTSVVHWLPKPRRRVRLPYPALFLFPDASGCCVSSSDSTLFIFDEGTIIFGLFCRYPLRFSRGYRHLTIRSEATEGARGTPPPMNGIPTKNARHEAGRFFCGDGRSRTAVQTPQQKAFYTLIPSLIVEERMRKDTLTVPLSPDLGGA